jgi:photosystem II stability/assembly factor-like uncharacterized protein
MVSRLYIATNGLSVWYSDNLGDELHRTHTAAGIYSGRQIWGLAAHPSNNGDMLCGTDCGLYAFDAKTGRWAHRPSQLDDSQMITALAFSPHDHRVVLAGTQSAKLYRSEDGGHSWARLDVPMRESVALRFHGDVNNNPSATVQETSPDNPNKHWTRVCQIVWDHVDPMKVYACVEIDDAWVSDDGGRTFERRNKGLAIADVHGMAVVNNGSKRLFATTAFGLHSSDDDGRTWEFQKINSTWQYTRSIIERPDRTGVMFLTNGSGAPGWEGRLYRSRDYGLSWEDVRLPGRVQSSVYFLAANKLDPSLIFAAATLGQLYRSTDGGESWTELPRRLGEIRAIAWTDHQSARKA